MRDALTRVALAGLILELGGCHLVDQRSFNAQAGRRPVPPVVAVVWPKTPGAYVTIQFAPGMEPDYRAALAVAVRRAMARKPDVLFSVATVVPISGGVEAQAASETAALERGREVAQAIVDAGADRSQIELVVRSDLAVANLEVRVNIE